MKWHFSFINGKIISNAVSRKLLCLRTEENRYKTGGGGGGGKPPCGGEVRGSGTRRFELCMPPSCCNLLFFILYFVKIDKSIRPCNTYCYLMSV